MTSDDNEPLPAQERFHAWMKLAEFRLRRWDARRDIEWKLSIAFWGLLVAAATTPVKPSSCVVVLAMLLAVGFYVGFWVAPILARNRKDQNVAFSYLLRAEQTLILGQKRALEPLSRPSDPSEDQSIGWAAAFQIATTILLAIAVTYVILARLAPKW